MDWDEEEGSRAPWERPAARESGREPRGEGRLSRKPLEERLEGWMSRGRELVDGVSGTRPGARPVGRGAERSGLDGLGRWVEGRLDWLLDDRDDWREPWQEGERTPARGRWEEEAPPTPSARRRIPLEAISRRSAPIAPATPSPGPRATPPATAPGDWPGEDSFSVPRWRREESSGARPVHPLEEPAPEPPPPPGRPLPRSTRRR